MNELQSRKASTRSSKENNNTGLRRNTTATTENVPSPHIEGSKGKEMNSYQIQSKQQTHPSRFKKTQGNPYNRPNMESFFDVDKQGIFPTIVLQERP